MYFYRRRVNVNRRVYIAAVRRAYTWMLLFSDEKENEKIIRGTKTRF